MLSLFGSILGFGTSFLPRILGFFETKRDQGHELKMMDKQLEHAQALHGQKMEMVTTDAEIRSFEAAHKSMSKSTGVPWVDGLRGTVRPMVTYIFMGVFVFVEISLMIQATKNGLNLTEAAPLVWHEETRALFATILAFWFGGRTFSKK